MARQVRGWDALRAWRFIRASRAYRDAWAKRRHLSGLPERAPFPVRLQTAADLAAAAWGMAAFEDPHAERPLAPFWTQAGVIDGRVAPDAPPLARLAAEGGAHLTGLRLGDGALMLRIEREGRSVQVRFPRGAVFPEDGGLLLVREVATIEDVWLGAPAPRPGRGRGRTETETENFCWRWKARRKGSPGARSRSASGAWSGSRRSTTKAAGCTPASSAAGRGRRRS